jgi:hypothetical protein
MKLLAWLSMVAFIAGCSGASAEQGSQDGSPVTGGSPSSGGSESAGAGSTAGRAGVGGVGGAGGDDGPVAGDATLANPMMAASGAAIGGGGGEGGVGGGSMNEPDPPDGLQCGAGFVDEQRHSAHCGECGQQCALYVLARELSWPTMVTLNATHAYWINNGNEAKVMRASLPHGEPEVLAEAQPWPMDIELDAQHVYWAGYGTIWKMPLEGGMPMRLVTSMQVDAQAIALDASHVYAVANGEENTASVIKVPKSGGEPITLAALSGMGPTSIAVDATHVYWANGNNNVDKEVLKVPLEGGEPVTLATGSSNVYAIAIDATHVYWAEHDTVASGLGAAIESAVRKVPLDGGTVVSLSSGTQQPMSLAIDSVSAYWTSASNSLTFSATPGTDGLVQAVPLAGGDPLMLGPLQDEPTGIGSNGTTVCWATTGNGQGSGSVKCLGACSQGSCVTAP